MKITIKYLFQDLTIWFLSCKFYGIAKIHKSSPSDNAIHLPIRHIVSNMKAITYHVSKYLATLLFPLSESEYK